MARESERAGPTTLGLQGRTGQGFMPKMRGKVAFAGCFAPFLKQQNNSATERPACGVCFYDGAKENDAAC